LKFCFVYLRKREREKEREKIERGRETEKRVSCGIITMKGDGSEVRKRR